MTEQSSVFVSIKELSDTIKETFVGAKVITVVINSNYIKDTKKFNNHYTSPIGYIIDKRLYTLDQLYKHCEDIKHYMLRIKNNWNVIIKSNPQQNIWAISCDTTNVKTFKEHEYYPTTVEEFNIDVDFDDDTEQSSNTEGAIEGISDEEDI